MVRHIVGHLAAIEAGECLFEDFAASVIEEAKVHLPGIAAPIRADILNREQPLLF